MGLKSVMTSDYENESALAGRKSKAKQSQFDVRRQWRRPSLTGQTVDRRQECGRPRSPEKAGLLTLRKKTHNRISPFLTFCQLCDTV